MRSAKNFKGFDELKNPDLEYRYSREERLKMHVRPLYSRPPAKGLARFFGGNKMVSTMFLFYIILGVFIFGYFTLYEEAEGREYLQVFRYPQDRTLQVRFLTNQEKYGLNISLENKGRDTWEVEGLLLLLPGQTNESRRLFRLAPGEFDALFLPLSNRISNISRLKVQLKGGTNVR